MAPDSAELELESLMRETRGPQKEAPPSTPKPAPITTKQIKETNQATGQTIVKGDLAKAWAPRVADDPHFEAENVLDNMVSQAKGQGAKASFKVVQPPFLMEQIESAKSPGDKILESIMDEGKSFITLGAQKASVGDPIIQNIVKAADVSPDPKEAQRNAFIEGTKESAAKFQKVTDSPTGKMREILGSEVAQNMMTTLSMDEHLMVKGAYKVSGLKNKENWGDYTWTNYLMDMGAEDNWETKALGLSMSIGLSPSTYLTFGASTEKRLLGAVKEMSLTNKGRAMVNNLVKVIGDAKVAELTSKGRTLERGTENFVRAKIKQNIEDQIVKRFSFIDKFKEMQEGGALAGKSEKQAIRKVTTAINKENPAIKGLKVGEEVAGLSTDILSKGGAKLDIPMLKLPGGKVIGGGEIPLLNFSPFQAADIEIAGQVVVKGEKVAAIASKMDPLINAVKESKVGQGVQESVDWLGKKLVYGYGVDQKLVGLFRGYANPEKAMQIAKAKGYRIEQIEAARLASMVRDAEESSNLLKENSIMRAETFFKGLNKEQRISFSEDALKASYTPEKIEKIVSSKGDKAVQDRLDAWFGQGKYKGKGIATELKEKSKALGTDFEELQNWYPGIYPTIDPKNISLKRTLDPSKAAEKPFLRTREIDPETGELLYKDMHSKNPVQAFATRLIQIGHAEIHDNVYRNVLEMKLGNASGKQYPNILEALKDGYDMLYRPNNVRVLGGHEEALVDAIDRGLKKDYYVKKEFADQFREALTKEKRPAVLELFHWNASMWRRMQTSLFPAFHARNFNSNIVLNSMYIGGHAFNPEAHAIATSAILGKNLEKEFVNEIGQRFTVQDMINEGKQYGVIKNHVHDLAGETMSPEAQSQWTRVLQHFNPLSKDFAWTQSGLRLGQAIEGQARLVNYIYWRKQGLSPKLAAREVDEALFNYGELTKFEAEYARLFMGFYTFSKKNIEGYMRVMGRTPGVVTNQLKFMRDLGPSETEWRESIPEFMKKQYAIKLNNFVYTGSGAPMEDALQFLSSPGKELVMRSNPVLRYLVEKGVGKDFYSDRPLEKVNNANEFKWIYRITENKDLPDAVKAPFWEIRKWMGLKPDEKKKDKLVGNPDTLHLLRSLATNRFASTIGMLEKEDLDMAQKTLRTLFGVVKYEPDQKLKVAIEKQQTIKRMKEKVNKENVSKDMPFYFYGGKPSFDAFANEQIKKVFDAHSVERLRYLEDKFNKKAEDRNLRDTYK